MKRLMAAVRMAADRRIVAANVSGNPARGQNISPRVAVVRRTNANPTTRDKPTGPALMARSHQLAALTCWKNDEPHAWPMPAEANTGVVPTDLDSADQPAKPVP